MKVGMKVGLFVPCYIDAFFPEVAVATLGLVCFCVVWATTTVGFGAVSATDSGKAAQLRWSHGPPERLVLLWIC